MLHISVMWHRAYFSLFIRPTLLHLCVIGRKFHLHANSIKFGHTPPGVPATFPAHLLERNTCMWGKSKQWTDFTESVQYFQYHSADKHGHINMYSLFKACSHTDCYLPECSSVETTPMTPGFVVCDHLEVTI